MSYDSKNVLIDVDRMDSYKALDPDIEQKYGSIVKAICISNREYIQRYNELSEKQNMKPPPSSHMHVYPGYLVVRNLGKSSQYETWIPDSAFDEIYKKN